MNSMNESKSAALPLSATTPPDSATPVEAPRQRSTRMSAEKALPQSGADTLVRIIKGYAVASNGGQTQINYKDVASAVGLGPTLVSKNNRFLLESEILTSPKFGFYIPSEGAIRFAREAAWDEPAAKGHLRRIVQSTWYGQVAVQNFTLRPALKREELKRALAIKCGATEGDSAALEFLIDFLIYTGIVILNENGSLARGEMDADGSTPFQDDRPTVPAPVDPQQGRQLAPSPVISDDRRQTAITVHVHIRTLDELTPANADRLNEWLRALRAGGEPASVSIVTEPAEGSES
jgi:hypothetical protein